VVDLGSRDLTDEQGVGAQFDGLAHLAIDPGHRHQVRGRSRSRSTRPPAATRPGPLSCRGVVSRPRPGIVGVMETIVIFHAHPDDEVIVTGGTIAKASDAGHRVVLVVATNGDHGDVPDDLGPNETLIDRRRAETDRSAAILGIHHVVWLGYGDSGMTGWEQNDLAESFWKADVDDAARRLATILDAEDATTLVVYDWHGVYGHPDHIKVHRVGHRAREIAGTPRLLEATMNRDAMSEFAAEMGEADFDPNGPADDGNPFGTPAAELNYAVDVTEYVPRKRAALSCHASQISDAGEMLQMPENVFARAFGTEYFIEPAHPLGEHLDWLFADELAV